MANTRSDVAVPGGAWVNLFTSSGVTVGTAATIYNKSDATVYVVIAASAPAVPSTTATPMGIPVLPKGSPLAIAAGASGLWGFVTSKLSGNVLVQD